MVLSRLNSLHFHVASHWSWLQTHFLDETLKFDFSVFHYKYIRFLSRKKLSNYYFTRSIYDWLVSTTEFYQSNFPAERDRIIYFSASLRGRGWPWWRLLESCWKGAVCVTLPAILLTREQEYDTHTFPHSVLTSICPHCVVCICTRALIPILRKTSVKAGCAYMHTSIPSRPLCHTHVGCCASAGARRPSSPVPPVCAGVSPRNFQLSNNKVPGWPNYCRERAARHARSLCSADRYFVSRINKATPRAAARFCVLCCDFVSASLSLDQRR